LLSPASRAYNAILYGMAWLAGILMVAMMAMIVADVALRNLGYQSSAHFFTFTEYFLLFIPLMAGVLALGLNEGAYAAEVVRGAIRSRPSGQTEACVALGIPPAKRMRRILIPQSIPAMLPPFGNVLVDLLKNTSLVSLVTVLDLTYQAGQIRINTGETAAVFLTLLVMYFILSLLLSAFMAWLERRFAIDRKARPKAAKLFSLPRQGAGA
jgi:polar amino acid transport system permease protein